VFCSPLDFLTLLNEAGSNAADSLLFAETDGVNVEGDAAGEIEAPLDRSADEGLELYFRGSPDFCPSQDPVLFGG
jgi:hypothetical protein